MLVPASSASSASPAALGDHAALADPVVLAALDEMARQVRRTADALDELAARCPEAARVTDWQAPSARHFHDRVEAWRGALLAERESALRAVDAAHACRARLVAAV